MLPAGVAEPKEIADAFGVWLLTGTTASGMLDLVRPARHLPCKRPFSVWLALAKPTPVSLGREAGQQALVVAAAAGEQGADALIHAQLQKPQRAADA